MLKFLFKLLFNCSFKKYFELLWTVEHIFLLFSENVIWETAGLLGRTLNLIQDFTNFIFKKSAIKTKLLPITVDIIKNASVVSQFKHNELQKRKACFK